MMKPVFSSDVEFITPSFLCGARQDIAELRPASIRGQLRWWFRALGGSREDEKAVFGGVHDGTVSSAVVVRVGNVQARHEPFRVPDINTPRSYLYYFATVSGSSKG